MLLVFLLAGLMRTIKEPVLAAWMNDHVDEKMRATVFSTSGQLDSRADHRRAYCGAGSPAGVHTLGAGLYRFPAVARAVLSAGGGKEAGLIWHS